jgi:hypothetical protein
LAWLGQRSEGSKTLLKSPDNGRTVHRTANTSITRFKVARQIAPRWIANVQIFADLAALDDRRHGAEQN